MADPTDPRILNQLDDALAWLRQPPLRQNFRDALDLITRIHYHVSANCPSTHTEDEWNAYIERELRSMKKASNRVLTTYLTWPPYPLSTLASYYGPSAPYYIPTASTSLAANQSLSSLVTSKQHPDIEMSTATGRRAEMERDESSDTSDETTSPVQYRSALPPAQLQEIRRRFEAARLFEDDDDYLPESTHGNTPTPGRSVPATKPLQQSAMPPPKGFKPMPLKKTRSRPTSQARVMRPSGLRQQQVPQWTAPPDARSRAGTVSSQPGGDTNSDVAASDASSMPTSHNSHASVDLKHSYPPQQAYAVQYPPLGQPDIDGPEDELEDGLIHGHWDRRCV